jgi:peptide deformylase
MAILPMHYIGRDPILREKARKVRDFNDPALHKLAEDMIDSMYYYSGVGIAANQIGSNKRICVMQLPDDEDPTVLINLEITRKEGEREVTEGCLSLPGWQGYIPRAEKVWAHAVGLDGKPIRYKGVEDLLAQALEHECDHLDGKLFVDYLRSKDDLYEVNQGEEEDGEGEPRPTSDASPEATTADLQSTAESE